MEIEYGPFQRQVRLAEDVDPERRDGELRATACSPIALPVVDRAAARGRIAIAVERR